MSKPILFLCILASMRLGSFADVRIERVPEHGLQPQVAVDAAGRVHLVYLTGKPESADIRYAVRDAGSGSWSDPITVNTLPQSAVAMGTIRGAQLALGGGSVVHVTWNGRAEKNAYATAPLYYAKLAAGKFSQQQTLNNGTLNLDGGASVAADGKGGVAIVWHASPPGGKSEAERRVYIARSTDEGTHFSAAEPAVGIPAGVCPCCSLKAHSSPTGGIMLLYRNASAKTQRDIALLTAKDGITFAPTLVHPWSVAACPMSSGALLSTQNSTAAAWETDGKIYYINLATKPTHSAPKPISDGNSRHPALATNSKGQTLVSWSVGTGWLRGGELRWIIVGSDGNSTSVIGSVKGLPVWSHTAVFPAGTEDFVVLY